MARRPIQQKIELTGGDEIIRILKQLGDSGEKAFKELQEAANKAGKDAAEFSDEINRVRQRLARIQASGTTFARSFDKFGSSLTKVSIAAQTVARRVALITAAASAAAGAIGFLVKGGLDYADEVAKQSRATGLSVAAYQSLQFALGQTGIEASEFGKVFARVNQALTQYTSDAGDAAKATTETTAKFTQYIGSQQGFVTTQQKAAEAVKDTADEIVSIESLIQKYNITTKDSGEAFLQLIDKISQLSSAQERAGELAIIFGTRVGPKLASAVAEGRSGLQGLISQFESTGFAITETEARAAEAANDAVSALGTIIVTARSKLAALFAPAVEQGANALIEILKRNREAIDAFVKSKVERVIQIVRDLISVFSGNDSAVQNTWILEWRDNIVSLKDSVVSAAGIIKGAFNLIFEAAGYVADGLNRVFGTDFDAKAVLIAAAVLQLVGGFGLLISVIGAVVSGLALIKATVVFLAALFGGPLVAAIGLFVAALALIVLRWETIKAVWKKGTREILDNLSSLGESIKATVSDFVSYIVSTVSNIGSGLWDGLTSSFSKAVDFIKGLWQKTIDFIKSTVASAISAAKSAASSAASAVGFARGGYVRGAGTATSDSIPAFLSNMEYVVNAGRVRQLGPRFFDFLNFAPLPKVRAAFSGVPRFAAGGLASSSPNLGGFMDGLAATLSGGFGGGGTVALAGSGGSMRPVNVNLGGGTVVPLQGAPDAIRQLIQASRLRSVSSTFGPSSSPTWNR